MDFCLVKDTRVHINLTVKNRGAIVNFRPAGYHRGPHDAGIVLYGSVIADFCFAADQHMPASNSVIPDLGVFPYYRLIVHRGFPADKRVAYYFCVLINNGIVGDPAFSTMGKVFLRRHISAKHTRYDSLFRINIF